MEKRVTEEERGEGETREDKGIKVSKEDSEEKGAKPIKLEMKMVKVTGREKERGL